MQLKGERNIAVGVAAGMLGGLLATWVMSEYQALFSASSGNDEKDEPATVKAAARISENVFGHQLTRDGKKIAGPAVHYTFGTLNGAVYGALAEASPGITAARGVLFGAGLWLIADEVAVPALGLSKSPAAYPPSTHLYSLTSHLVYGFTTDFVRRLVGRMLK